MSHLRDFVAVLSGFESCPSTEASAALMHVLTKEFTPREVALWRQPSKGVWRSLQAGAPCRDTTAKWWIQPNGSSTSSWHAHPAWSHCCNKAVSIARCPGKLLETPCRCYARRSRERALEGHCVSDATLLCEPFFRVPHRTAGGSAPLVYSFGLAGEWAFEEW